MLRCHLVTLVLSKSMLYLLLCKLLFGVQQLCIEGTCSFFSKDVKDVSLSDIR